MTATTQTLGLAPGSVVVVRDEEWLVRATEETSDGPLVHVQGLSELVRDVSASFYASLDDIEALDPAEARVVGDDSAQHRKARLWLEATLRKTAIPIGDPALSVSTQALADPLAYQQSAVRQALDPENLRPRILLADAVGLGKTLEIGMILSELVRRGRGERILIVSPKHVLEQMQHEMWTRFALPFVRLDSAGIQRVRQKLPATRNPFTYFRRVIISIDTLKSDKYVAHLRKQRWDAVVIDESHNLANSSTQNNRLARLLAGTCDALILASATPHNGRKESFAELVRLLDPSAVTPQGELVKDEVKRLVIRRHRHSPEVAQVVGADWAERQAPRNLLVAASGPENAVARELDEVWLHPAGGRSPYSGENASLFPWTLAKAFLSSPAALRKSIDERRVRIRHHPGAGDEDAALLRLRDLNERTLTSSAKYDRLVELLREVGVRRGADKRVVVFAERIPTLLWLQDKLPRSLGIEPDAVEVMHGGLADDEQQRIVEAFKQGHAKVRVLVTGDVASEGVNLHAQCHELVHYDIPWSLIRIEQRNGRIDRYGQKTPPRITTLLLDPSSERFSGDVHVLTRLVDKEHEAHQALGDAASLMGEYDVRGEEEQIRRVLAGQQDLDAVVRTPEQVREADDVAGLFADLFDAPVAPAPATPPVPPTRGSGLYADEVAFLEDALAAAFTNVDGPISNDGVEWRRYEANGAVSLVPPRDLAQRLEVLPQTYLADRRVTEKLMLATTTAAGKTALKAALSDTSESTWPEAHYLGPLHPVVDWAADRALAALGRNEVFAVRGTVDEPTVLLVGTLTNRRGQMVAASWLTAVFPVPEDPTAAFVTPHPDVRSALEQLGWTTPRVNPGAVDGEPLERLIAPAVAAAAAQMATLFEAASSDVDRRVDAWSNRLQRWDDEADALFQRSEIKQRRVSVRQEKELVGSMKPDRQLVRPLLVVVPEEWA